MAKSGRVEENVEKTAGLKEALDNYALEESCIAAITDQRGMITYANDNFCKISKYTVEELSGQNHCIINSGFHTKEFTQDLWATISGGKIWSGELMNKAKDGTCYWLDTTIIPCLNESGSPYQYVAIRADITMRKLAEDEASKIHQETENVLNRISDSIISVDNNWRYTFLNDAALVTHTKNRHEIIGKAIWDVHPEIKHTLFWDKYREAMVTKKVVEFESFYAPVNIWFSVKVYPSPSGLTIFYRDVTVQVENENLTQTIYTASLDAVIIIDEVGIISKWDVKSERLFGWTEKEVIGKKLAEMIIPERHRAIHDNGIKDYLKSGDGAALGKTIDTLARKKNGIEFDVSLRISPSQINGRKHFIGLIRDISENKKAEQQQEFEKNNLNALINNTCDLMWSVDLDARLITFNQPFYDTIRHVSGKEVAKGDDVFSVVLSPEQRDRFKISYARAFAGEAFTETECITTPAEFWSEISYYPIRKGDEVIGTACHSRDITERKSAEKYLQESEARLKEGQAIAHLGTWELNFSTGEALWSEEAVRIYGLSGGSKLTFETWVSFIHPEDIDEVMVAVTEGQKTFTGTSINHRIILADGTIKHIHSKSKFEFNQQGKPIGLYGVVLDITEKKIAEENLRLSEASLREAQAIAHVGNWEIDLVHGHTHTWSEEMYNFFGLTIANGSASAELFLSFMHPDDLEYTTESIRQALTTFKNSSIDFRVIRKDGELRYGYSEWEFLFDKNKNPIRLFGIIQDVTERKLAEIERTRMVNDLMLRNKDLEQFAFIVSHNLRSPVANILGAASELKEPGLTSEDQEILREGITESVTKLDNVVQDLSKILQVKQEIRETKEKIIFSELVNDIKASIKNLIDKDQVKIECDFSEVNEMFSLKTYLYSIFYNLISNSIKFRQPNIQSLIEIKSHQLNEKIELVFTDNGRGIDLKTKGDQVFGLYKRFHPSIEGKGMGLFMVKTQVETLGGKMSIHSEVNKGTEFKIEF